MTVSHTDPAPQLLSRDLMIAEGIRRHHSAPEESDCPARRSIGGTKGLLEHPQVRPDGGPLQLRQHVQRDWR